VLIQVNVSGAASKFGVTPAEAVGLLRDVAKRDRLAVGGFMTVGLNSDDAEQVRAGYRLLRQLRDQARDGMGLALPVLSMGMSGDMELAVAEGATLVRVGSAVFGPRRRE
jgi:uncharacterized pyridoxal phosphate-containing UPF0001 family protein